MNVTVFGISLSYLPQPPCFSHTTKSALLCIEKNQAAFEGVSDVTMKDLTPKVH